MITTYCWRLTSLFILFSFLSFGQDKEDSVYIRKNSVYYELWGNGIGQSLNYDRIVPWKNPKIKNAFRIGIGFDNSSSDDTLEYHANILITELNFLFGTGKGALGFLEIGLGYSHYLDPLPYYEDTVLKERKDWSVNFLRIGFRGQSEKGFTLRAALLPGYSRVFDNPDKYSFGIWGGISFGYSFNFKKK